MRNPNEHLQILDGDLERRYYQPTFHPRAAADLPEKNLHSHPVPQTWMVSYRHLEVVRNGRVLHRAPGRTQALTIPMQKTSSAIALTRNGWFPVGFDPCDNAPLYLLDVNTINRIKNLHRTSRQKTVEDSEDDLMNLLNDKGSFVSPMPIVIEGNPRRARLGNGPISHARDLIKILKKCLPESNVIGHEQHTLMAQTAERLRALMSSVFRKEVALYEHAVPLLRNAKDNRQVIQEIDQYAMQLELFGTSLMRLALLGAAAGGKKNDNWFTKLLKVNIANSAPNVAADFRHLYLLLLSRDSEELGCNCFLTQDLLLAKFWCTINPDPLSRDIINGVAQWDIEVDAASAPQLSGFSIESLRDVRQA